MHWKSVVLFVSAGNDASDSVPASGQVPGVSGSHQLLEPWLIEGGAASTITIDARPASSAEAGGWPPPTPASELPPPSELSTAELFRSLKLDDPASSCDVAQSTLALPSTMGI